MSLAFPIGYVVDIIITNFLQLKPEKWKTIIGMLYCLTVTWVTAIVMVVVHDRVPDMQKYPPLPDIFLDNVPLIPWAFNVCELTALVLFSIWIGILLFHKHRYATIVLLFFLCAQSACCLISVDAFQIYLVTTNVFSHWIRFFAQMCYHDNHFTLRSRTSFEMPGQGKCLTFHSMFQDGLGSTCPSLISDNIIKDM